MKVKVAQLCPTLCDPMECSPWTSLGQNTGVGSLSLLQGIFPTPWVKPKSPPLQTDSLPAKPQGKPKNTGVDSLSLLQQIFPTQESNRGLLHHGQILYQLSYQGSPKTGQAVWYSHLFKNFPQFVVIHTKALA